MLKVQRLVTGTLTPSKSTKHTASTWFSYIHCGKIPFPKEQVNLKMTIISQVVMSHAFNHRRQRLVNLSARPVLSTQRNPVYKN